VKSILPKHDASPAEQQPAGWRVHQPLIVVLVAYCAGIAADRCWAVPPVVAWAVAAECWLVWLLLWRRGWNRVASGPLLAVVACLGGVWHHCCWHCVPADEIGRFTTRLAQPVCVEAIVRDEPHRVPAPPPTPLRTIPTGDRTEVDLRLAMIRNRDRWQPVSGRTELTVDGHLLGIHAGDRIRVFGMLDRPSPATNPGQFDSSLHLRAERRWSVLRAGYPECVERLQQGESPRATATLGGLSESGLKLLSKVLKPEYAGLAGALLLGRREDIRGETIDAYFTTGTIHVLVVSGLHVGILAGFLLLGQRLGWLSRGATYWIVIVLIWLYALLTGANPPVIRAAVLVTIFCLAKRCGRRAVGFNSLALAALIVLAINPAELFRTGPQLSFLAVAGLTMLAEYLRRERRPDDPLERLIDRSRSWPHRAARRAASWYWQMTLASLAVWLLLTPLTMYRFHLFSPAAMLLTPLLWLPLAFALVSGFALLTIGWLVPPLAAPLGSLCDANLALLHGAVTKAEQTAGSHLWVPGPPAWWLAIFYGAFGILIVLPRLRPRLRWLWAGYASWIMVGVLPALFEKPREELRCTFVNIGHGCGAVLELPGGETMLYDAGRIGSPATPSRTIAGCLWSRGIMHLDAVVLSHADADHYNALPELLEKFSVGIVYVSPVMFEQKAPALMELERAIREAGVPLREVWVGDRLRTSGEVTIDVLHPPRQGVLGSDNANSIVLAVEYAGRRMLLPGDLEQPGIEDVLAEEPYDTDVVLAPHHGSRNSEPFRFARWSTPEWLIISGGRVVDASDAKTTYQAAGARIIHTAQRGAVEVLLARDQLRVAIWDARTGRFEPSKVTGIQPAR